MKNIKKIFVILITLLVCINTTISVIADTVPANNEQQITKNGGEAVGDGVKISKMIYPTDIENYFDIVLNVQTRRKAVPQDLAVVIVMDISRTMIENKLENEDTTRLRAALTAGRTFLETFAKNSNNSTAKRKIGYVAFNRDGHILYDIGDCKDADSVANIVEQKTLEITTTIDEDNETYKKSKDRFTNIEGGLQVAYDMLYNNNETKDIKNKYIIFLSDGFPTTYLWKDYLGHDAIRSDKGILYDDLRDKPMTYGTNYSERGARKAQEKATSLKDKGTIIYSIGTGIDKNAKTIEDYDNAALGKEFSTIDRFDKKEYAIGNSLNDFKRWLGGTGDSTNPGIGSGYDNGYYFDTSDSESLNKAYENIFKTITSLSEASWVAEDPMNDESISTKNIEFVGIYDKSNNKDNISDSVSLGNNSDNTASYNPSDDKINWDLKNSNYTTFVEDNTTYYNYQLKYRIRLKMKIMHLKLMYLI